MVAFKVTRVGTTPFDGQKPGTSGLRKKFLQGTSNNQDSSRLLGRFKYMIGKKIFGDRHKVKVFTQPHYLQNFVQATFNALGSDKVKGATLVVSGDGRYFSKDAIQIITKMAAANGVRRVWVGQHGLMSTPAVSAVVRDRVGADGSKANGAFILTASHNPGGPHEDFGVKYNMENGGPAPEGVTNKIYENTTTIKEYLIAEGLPDVDISKTGVSSFEGPDGKFDVDVFDSTIDYVKLMKSIFDFPSIQKLLSSPKFGFCYDALHGVAGYYAKRIFVEELGGKESSLLNCVPKEDFGGGHPDPNLTYAKELVARMGLSKSHSEPNPPEFGAAADGDADRNMILGKRFFVTPSDSVAIIAANAVEAIPYFSGGLKGVARSMPTSAALDVVAKSLNLKFYEVPTGWKFFGNLMDAGMCSICGEESFGTGSDHIREKDGIWAVLAWLSILANKNKDNLGGEKLVSVEDIVRLHWATYGRHYYTRYDYENVDAAGAKELMAHLVKLQSSLDEVNKIIKGIHSDVSNVVHGDEFEYKDPVDSSISKHQGIRYLFEDGSRLVFRLSGTGSEGATIRVYIEQYEKDPSKIGRDSQEALAPLVEVAIKLSKMQEFTGRSAPTVIT
ncbi:PREDICTED: phosphoglucomutase, cytoplasmic-like isoform X1 [Nicotiana attenuata]|nr:PREDICTED: phosphoglucomutase, cytoplasmic-like isoform X1 [Nicotiana attenuata]XP_019249948.1 PREDICTED: phosphoglucomutase, cytoplasmic-like isoform X1 [Nicotiana attenuata]